LDCFEELNAATMANNKKEKKTRAKVAESKGKKEDAQKNLFSSKSVQWATVIVIAVIVFLFFQNSLENLFTKWDDPGYVVNNPLVKNFSIQGLKDIFSLSNPVMGNYHPLTILTYLLEYDHAHLDPWLYHFDSLLLHILNVLLVFWLVRLQTGRYAAAIITALLFGLHPLHVESVAWVAGRKDVLYGFFFLAACVSWVYFLRREGLAKWALYSITVVLFVCSLLSKPVAVSLPLVLLLIDYWEEEKLKPSVLINKIPFVLIAVILGLLSLKTQASAGSLATASTGYSMIERALLGFYSLVTYLWKAIIPVHLRIFYPYPGKPGSLSPILYLYPFLVLGLLGLIWKYARGKRAVIFGVGFFLVNIALLLQFIPVGTAIVADRYSYISYLGLFVVVGWFVSEKFKDNLSDRTGNILMAGVVAYCLILGYLSHERNKVWHDSTSLWISNMNMLPEDADAYNNLGYEYFLKADETPDVNIKKRDYDSSIILLKKSVEIKPDFMQSYVIMGELMRNLGRYDEALQNLNMATKVNPEDAAPYLSKAILYCITQKLDSAKMNFEIALKRNPYFPEAHCSFGNYFDMTGQLDSALAQYSLAVTQNPDFAMAYLNRGKFYLRRGNFIKAQPDFDKLVVLKPENGEGYYFRGISEYRNGNKQMAKQDITKALSLGYNQMDKALYEEIEK